MQKVARTSAKLESLTLFSMLQRSGQGSIFDPSSRQNFVSLIEAGLTEALDSEGTLHGVRVQSMFEGMVANLDGVKFLKQEDAGECYYSGDILNVPDFRIVTNSDEMMLVEVKNQYHRKPLGAFSIRRRDLEGLQRYAAITNVPLKFAIYWGKWRQWTLTSPSSFTIGKSRAELDFRLAMRHNEMASLGDYSVGSEYPLVLRLVAAKNRPRSLSENHTLSMHVAERQIFCGDTRITDVVEQGVVMHFMLFGKWDYDGGRVEIGDDGLPEALVHTVTPPVDQITDEQGFEIVGSLSSMYSQLYNAQTSEQGELTQLRLGNMESLAPLIPRDLIMKNLSLWRFTLVPNLE